MLVKYCPMCANRPFTLDMSTNSCPVCGAVLATEFVDEANLRNRPKIQFSFSNTDFDWDDNFCDHQDNQNGNMDFLPTSVPNQQHLIPERQESADISTVSYNPPVVVNEREKTITGKVLQYSSSGREDGEYRRLFFQKVIDAIVYKQRVEDVLHRFVVRVDNGGVNGYSNYIDIPVNVHGTISGGMQIVDNADVEVTGKYRNGVLMANKISVLNGGYKSKIKLQHTVSWYFYSIVTLFVIGALIYYCVTSNGDYIDNLKHLFVYWAISFAVIFVLYLVLFLSKFGMASRFVTGKPKKFPWFSLLIVSLAIAIIVAHVFASIAIKNVISSVLSSLLVFIVVIVAIIILIKTMIK